MTDETKRIFNAPWKTTEHDWVTDCNGHGFTQTETREQANRLACLPELYDALAEAIREACCDCIDQVYDSPSAYDPVLQGCLFQDKECCEKCRRWIALLNKVKDGK